ncbi:MAG: tryptophan--tRNA ligase [Eubacteriales bacterium]|nr:tryptophan--tRNA ligase [Eubacteriales bacterium]
MQEKEKTIILTGDRPTGRLHIGHYVGSLRRRVEIQNGGDFDEMYIMIADVQALTDNAEDPERIRRSILEVALDYLACGLDPNRVHLFVQSQVRELFELFTYYLNLVTLARLERNPTVKSEIRQRDFDLSIPAGFLTYPVSQCADITAFDATIVPVGEDQLPMIEQAQEIVRKFNSVYPGANLVLPKAMLPESGVCQRLPGTDGKAKMSKSLGNCIYLSDDEETVNKQVMTMFTDPNHLRVSDPGETENNPVFTYLQAFCEDAHVAKFWPEYASLAEIEAHYRRGGLGDVKVKRFLAAVLNDVLDPIRKRRQIWAEKPEEVLEILERGSIEASKKAKQTCDRVRNAMRIDYFSTNRLI